MFYTQTITTLQQPAVIVLLMTNTWHRLVPIQKEVTKVYSHLIKSVESLGLGSAKTGQERAQLEQAMAA